GQARILVVVAATDRPRLSPLPRHSNECPPTITGSDAYSIHYDIGTGTSTPNSSSSGVNTIMDNGLGGNVKYPYTVLKRGKKHHAFSSEVVPYPLNYEARILD
ncbi:3473_t:CDS:2, partial [Acaulospora colombiana]